MKRYSILIMLVLAFSACGGGGDSGGNSGTEISREYLSVTPNLELLAEGQSTEITISANCSWTITKNADWLTVSPMSGASSQQVTVSASRNTTREDRTAVLSVKGGSLPARMVTITQKRVEENYNLSVNTDVLDYDNKGGTKNFIITSNTSWEITCPGWCKLSMKSGKGNATISVTADKNTTTQERTGNIQISGEGVGVVSISVSQEADAPHEPGSDDNQPPS